METMLDNTGILNLRVRFPRQRRRCCTCLSSSVKPTRGFDFLSVECGSDLQRPKGGKTPCRTALRADLYNRQLHPDARQWPKDSAGKFAQFYQDQTGQTITAEQALQMLLASGYQLVDAAAGAAPDGTKYATAFISQNENGMFFATSAEFNSPFLYGNANHSLTPEQMALIAGLTLVTFSGARQVRATDRVTRKNVIPEHREWQEKAYITVPAKNALEIDVANRSLEFAPVAWKYDRISEGDKVDIALQRGRLGDQMRIIDIGPFSLP
jgi:hypothetical protein